MAAPTEAKLALRRIHTVTGWHTECLDYPSSSRPLQELANGLVAQIKDKAGSSGSVLAVTHSMGGLPHIRNSHCSPFIDLGCNMSWSACHHSRTSVQIAGVLTAELRIL